MLNAGVRHAVRGLVILGFTLGLQAGDPGFFDTQNQSPMVSIFGLPTLGAAQVLGPGQSSFGVTVDLANNFTGADATGEQIYLDGESTRLTLSGRYGLGARGEVGIELPVIEVGGGFLDHFIETYHSTFGFPDHGRELAPQGRLLYRYSRNGLPVLDMERGGTGLGDLRLTGAWQLGQSADQRRSWTLRGSLKLPTGKAQRLRGSGSTDLALWVVGSSQSGRMSVMGAAGAMLMSRGEVLAAQQRPAVAFGGLALAYEAAGWLDLKAQVNAHSSFYSGSQLKQVNAASGQLTLGGEFRLSRRTSLDFGVSEDIVVDASPDVVFHFGVRHKIINN